MQRGAFDSVGTVSRGVPLLVGQADSMNERPSFSRKTRQERRTLLYLGIDRRRKLSTVNLCGERGDVRPARQVGIAWDRMRKFLADLRLRTEPSRSRGALYRRRLTPASPRPTLGLG